MKEVTLTRGYVAAVDDDDYDWLMGYSWHAQVMPKGYECTRDRLRKRVEARTAVRVELPDGNYAYRPTNMHRLIMDAKPGQMIDHINGDTLDNRRENLRFVTNQQNSWNARGAKTFKGRPTSSRFKGVFKKVCKTKYSNYEYWVAKIGVNGKEITVYHGKDEVEAACHYDMAAQHYFGEYAKLNFDGAAYDEWYTERAMSD